MAINVSLLAIPIYYLLVLWPSFTAGSMIVSTDAKSFDNANPRSIATPVAYKKLLGPKDFAKWERCKAAHFNGFETFSLFVATVFAGLYAQLPARALDLSSLGVLGLRILYNILYIQTERRRNSYYRSAVWFLQLGTCLGMLAWAGVECNP